MRKIPYLVSVLTLLLLFFSPALLTNTTRVQAQTEPLTPPPGTVALTPTVKVTTTTVTTVVETSTVTATVVTTPTLAVTVTPTATAELIITPTATITLTPTPLLTATSSPMPPTPTATLLPPDTATAIPVLSPSETPTFTAPIRSQKLASLTIYLPLIMRATPELTDQAITGLVGYWPLNESSGKRSDKSGRGNTLASTGVGSAQGKINRAADFEQNQGDYLSISDRSQTGLDIPGDLTLAGWINLESQSNADRVIASKYSYGNGTERRAYRLDVRNSGNRLGFIVSPNGKFSSNYLLEARLSSPLKTGRWYFVAAVFDADAPQLGRSKLTLYVDGQVVGSKTVGFTQPHNTNAPFMLGANLQNQTPAQFFDGKLDDWRVYRAALSKSEIQGLRGSNPAPTPTPAPSSGSDNSACNPSNGSGGLAAGTIKEIRLNGLRSSIVVGDGYKPNTPTYLVFYLHGDEGNYTSTQSSGHPVTKLVKQRGWIMIQPESPESQTRWWKNPDSQARQLKGALDEMFSKYNLCRNTILGGAWSGGSIFWSKTFFPTYGTKYPAHTILFCGGGKPSATIVNRLGNNSAVVARSSFKFTYGSKDHLRDDILDAISVYRGAGFKVVKNELAGVGHCVPDLADKFKNFLISKSAELKID